MTRSFSLWDRDTANVIGWYDTEDEALAAVRGLLVVNDPVGADDLLLLEEYPSGVPELIGAGRELAARAMGGGKPYKALESPRKP